MPKWSRLQRENVGKVREALGEALNAPPQFPEVIGDRRVLRFLQAHEGNVAKAAEMLGKFLTWRKENGVDAIRERIINDGLTRPNLFPNGDIFSKVAPSVAIAPYVTDRAGHPIVVDKVGYSMEDLRVQLGCESDEQTNTTLVTYLTWILEYRALVLEQLSEEREEAFLATLSPEERAEATNEDDEFCKLHEVAAETVKEGGSGGFFASLGWGSSSKDVPSTDSVAAAAALPNHLRPYGVIAQYIVIRDLGDLSLDSVGGGGRDLLKIIIRLISENYPEMMIKSYCVNTPWIFTTLWWFIQSLLSANIVAKVSVLGTDFKTVMEPEIELSNLPDLIGGPLHLDPDYEFPFDKDFFNGINKTVALQSEVRS